MLDDIAPKPLTAYEKRMYGGLLASALANMMQGSLGLSVERQACMLSKGRCCMPSSRAEREARAAAKAERETSPDVVDADIYGDGGDRWYGLARWLIGCIRLDIAPIHYFTFLTCRSSISSFCFPIDIHHIPAIVQARAAEGEAAGGADKESGSREREISGIQCKGSRDNGHA